MITVNLSDKPIQVENGTTLKDLLVANGYVSHDFAVAINRQFIPRQHYSVTIIHAGDMIDLVKPMQGG